MDSFEAFNSKRESKVTHWERGAHRRESMKNLIKVDVVASDGGNQTFCTVGDKASYRSKGGQSCSKELDIFLNGLNKYGCIVGIERGPNGGRSATQRVKLPLGRGLADEVVERIDGQDEE